MASYVRNPTAFVVNSHPLGNYALEPGEICEVDSEEAAREATQSGVLELLDADAVLKIRAEYAS